MAPPGSRLPPHSRRRWRCPRPTSRATGSAPATSAPAAWRLAHTGGAVRGRPGASRSSTASPARISGWWSRWRGLRRGAPPGGPVTGSPATVSVQGAVRVELDAAGREAARGEHHGVGRERPRRGPRRARSTPRHAPAARPRRPPPTGPARGGRPPRAGRSSSARCSRMPGTEGGRVGISDDRRAEPLLQVVPRLAGALAGRAPPAAPRSRRARAAAAARRASARAQGRVVERRGRAPAPATSARPGRADEAISSGRASTRRPVGQVGARQVVGQQRGEEVLQRAQPDDGEARSRAQVARAAMPAGASAVGRATPTAVGSSRLRPRSPA